MALAALSTGDLAKKLEAEFNAQDVSEPAEETTDANPDRVAGEPEGKPDGSEAVGDDAETPAEEPGQLEAKADGDPETDGQVAKIPGLSDEQKKHYSKLIQERVRKESEKRREAAEKAEALEVEAKELREKLEQAQASRGVAITPANPVANVFDPARLAELEQAAQTTEDWADNLMSQVGVDPYGVETELKAQKVELAEYSAGEMLKFLKERRQTARGVLRSAPKQREFIQQRTQWDQAAEKEFAFWKQPKSRERQLADKLLADPRPLSALPEVKFWLGHALTSFFRKLDEVNADKAAPEKKPAPSPAAPPAKRNGAPVINGGRINGKPASSPAASAFEKTPTARALEDKLFAEL